MLFAFLLLSCCGLSSAPPSPSTSHPTAAKGSSLPLSTGASARTCHAEAMLTPFEQGWTDLLRPAGRPLPLLSANLGVTDFGGPATLQPQASRDAQGCITRLQRRPHTTSVVSRVLSAHKGLLEEEVVRQPGYPDQQRGSLRTATDQVPRGLQEASGVEAANFEGQIASFMQDHTTTARKLLTLATNPGGNGSSGLDGHGASTYKPWLWDCTNDKHIHRYKLYNGTVYSWGEDHTRELGTWHRIRLNSLMEMLLVSLWLYKGFSDLNMDFWLCSSDTPCRCHLQLPFLQYTIINQTSILGGQMEINPSSLTGGMLGSQPSSCLAPYTKGYAITYPYTYKDLSMSPGQMRAYSDCLVKRYASSSVPTGETQAPFGVPEQSGHAAWAQARIPRVLWRGGGSGQVAGWSPLSGSDPINHVTPLASFLMNKRILMTLMSRPHPFMDVGITMLWSSQSWGNLRGQSIEAVVRRKPLTMEAWSKHMFSISIDGMGPPWRLPQQLLGMSPVIKLESPLKEPFSQHLIPGVHYEAVKYDLSDLLSRSQQLVEEGQANSTRLQHMAEGARDLMIQTQSALAQLDSFVWSLLHVKRLIPWKVAAPDTIEGEGPAAWRPANSSSSEEINRNLAKGWRIVRFSRGYSWRGRAFSPIQQEVVARFPQHFQV